ncbi:hypothetical protein EVAR_84402_1 [Eumeta japonica]|uniref:Uncharacterized protein n=1 Tax=Eumeta variegata TaxID=151549 RepID=A0A4C1YH24_EUMVA|nr:hypothetical protein EVAR_84402_1 [Eumeta japonica]
MKHAEWPTNKTPSPLFVTQDSTESMPRKYTLFLGLLIERRKRGRHAPRLATQTLSVEIEFQITPRCRVAGETSLWQHRTGVGTVSIACP